MILSPNSHAWFSMASVAERFVILVLILLGAHVLSVSDYADFQRTTLLAALIAGPLSAGFTSSLAKLRAQGGDLTVAANDVLRYGLLIHTICYVSAVILAFHGPFVLDINEFGMWAFLFVETMVAFNVFRNVLVGIGGRTLQSFATVALIACASTLVVAIASTCLPNASLMFSCGPRLGKEVIAIYVLSVGLSPFAVVGSIIHALRTARDMSYARSHRTFLDPTIFAYAALAAVLGIACDALEFFVGWIFLSDFDFAAMRSAAIRVPLIEVITVSATTVAIHQVGHALARNESNSAAAAVRGAAARSITWVLPVTIYCLVFAQPLVLALFGPRYEAAGPLLAVYYVKYSITHIVLGIVLPAIGEPGYVIRLQLLYLGFMAPLMGAICWIGGPYLVVPVAVAAFLLMHISLLKHLAFSLRTTFLGIFPIKLFLMVALVSLGVAMAISYLLTKLDMPSSLWLLVIAAAGHYVLCQSILRSRWMHSRA
jgi:hypothetical protein